MACSKGSTSKKGASTGRHASYFHSFLWEGMLLYPEPWSPAIPCFKIDFFRVQEWHTAGTKPKDCSEWIVLRRFVVPSSFCQAGPESCRKVVPTGRDPMFYCHKKYDSGGFRCCNFQKQIWFWTISSYLFLVSIWTAWLCLIHDGFAESRCRWQRAADHRCLILTELHDDHDVIMPMTCQNMTRTY